MKEYARNVRASQLTLADAPTSDDGAAKPAATASESSLALEAQDSFLAEAEKEYATGRVDAPLWARAVKEAGGDKAKAKQLYLDGRATALRAAKRNKHVPPPPPVESAAPAPVVKPRRNAPEPGSFAPEVRYEPASKAPRRNRPVSEGPNRRLVLVAGALGSVVVVVVAGWMVLRSGNAPAEQASIAKPVPAFNASGRSSASARTAAAATNAPAPVREENSAEDVAARVQALEQAGNWNLLVIYATEWTRKQPGNAAAWKEVSRGYVKLSQFGDALDAAKKAAQLAPQDFLAWQNLGQLYIDLQRPAEALEAFQRAEAVNDRDVVSLAQEGLLNTQLGHVAEARIAFDKALAVSPDYGPARCGAAALAQNEGRAKGASATARQVKPLDACRDGIRSEAVRVVANGAAK